MSVRRWCRGTRGLVGVATGWLAFVAAQRVLSGRWWVWLLPDAVPPVAFVAAPLALLSAGLRLPLAARWWVSGAALLAGALGFDRSGINLAALTGKGPVPPQAVRVFVWNTEYWHQTTDPNRFYGFLRAQHADVYLLQEHLHWDRGPVRIDDTAALRAAFPGYTIVIRGELVTLSRFPVVDRLAVATAKVLRTDLLVHGHVMSFYNVHISVHIDTRRNPLTAGFYRYVRHTNARREGQFAELAADIAGNPHPVLVAGDFNTSPAMGDLAGLRARLRDAATASTSLYPVSWLGLWRLDWTFTGNGVRVHRCAFGTAVGMSDHRPQEIVISPS